MDSTARFLLGGALGAALGYLVSQKKIQKALRRMQVPSAQLAPSAASLGAPAVQAEHATVSTPLSAPIAAPMPSPMVSTPVVEAPEWQPISRPAPTYAPMEPETTTEARVETAPYIQASVEPPPVETPATPEMTLAEQLDQLVPSISTQPESEVIVTRDFLEEPLPGSGWKESTAAVVEEETFEEILPEVPDEFAPYEAPEVPRPPFEMREGRPAAPWSEVETETLTTPPVQEISETGLEMETPALSSVDEPFFEAPVVEAPVEEVLVEDVPVEEALVEEPYFAPSLVSEPEMGTVPAESVEISAPVAEAPIFEAPIFEAPAFEAQMPEAPPAPEIAPVDDLKARIEETRRRIRQELEQPFVSANRGQVTEEDWTTSPAVPVIEEAAQPLPAAAEPVEPVLSDAPVAEPAGLESPEPDEPFSLIAEPEVDGEPTQEKTIDYDSMRSRIEVTRSRLKAKAFDAMMTGESALLGRDTEDAAHRQKVVPAVDSEVNETIESSLREEED